MIILYIFLWYLFGLIGLTGIIFALGEIKSFRDAGINAYDVLLMMLLSSLGPVMFLSSILLGLMILFVFAGCKAEKAIQNMKYKLKNITIYEPKK